MKNKSINNGILFELGLIDTFFTIRISLPICMYPHSSIASLTCKSIYSELKTVLVICSFHLCSFVARTRNLYLQKNGFNQISHQEIIIVHKYMKTLQIMNIKIMKYINKPWSLFCSMILVVLGLLMKGTQYT